jgi:DNA-binding HxlR family transcriptional regulator
MSRTRFAAMNCSLAQALEVLGDWWTLLIVREAFLGTRRFVDFQRELGVARNVLSERLQRLVQNGVLEKVEAGEFGSRQEYQLTPMGKDLYAVITALRQWADKWVYGPGKEPLLVIDRRSGRPLPRLRVLGSDGKAVRARDLELRPGPGADAGTRARFGARSTP